MSFQETFKIISESQLFKNFKQDYPEAELIAGFFILDFLSNDNKNSLDYEAGDKIFTFSLNERGEVFVQEDKLMDIPNTQKLTNFAPPEKLNAEVEELRGLAGTEALDNGISAKFHKIIAVLQNYQDSDIMELQEPKLIWNLTCMLDNLIILHVLIDSHNGKVLKFERKSMMDMIQKK